MKLYKISGNYGWLICTNVGNLHINEADSIYKNHFNSAAIVKSFYEINYSYPSVIVSSLYKND